MMLRTLMLELHIKTYMPGKAEYFNENCRHDRWNRMVKIKRIDVKDYDLNGDFIYICCNRGSSGYSGRGVNALYGQ